MSMDGRAELSLGADYSELKRDFDIAKSIVGEGFGNMARNALATVGAFAVLEVAMDVARWLGPFLTSAIDAAESLHDLSIQTGATVESLSAMAEVGRTTNTSAQDIGSAMNKLAKNMAVANEESKGTAEAIKALGLDFNTFRALKPEDQMVQLAQAMNKFEDGGSKSAAAMTLLGKEGAKLLPFMRDLATAGALVATTTAEQADMADQFNDALTESAGRTDAMVRSVSFALLPALIAGLDITRSLGDAFSSYMAAGARESAADIDGLGVAVRVVSAIFETLILIGSDVAFVFNGIRDELGGIGAQAAALLRGDFAQIGAIHEEMKNNAVQARAELDKFQSSVVGATDKVMAARDAVRNHSLSASENNREMSRLQNTYGTTGRKVLEYSAQVDKAKQAQQKIADATRDYIRVLDDKLELSTLELINGGKLNEGETALIELRRKLRDGTIAMTEEQVKAAEATIASTQANLAAIKASNDYAETLAKVASHSSKLEEEQGKVTDSMREQLVQLREENEKLGMTEKQWAARVSAQMRAQAAELEMTAAMEGGNYQLTEQARLLRERADLADQGVILKEAQDSAAEWKKTTDSIGDGLTDALFRGLEAGQSMWVAFRDTLVNSFKQLVLQPTIKAIMAPVAGGIGSLFSGVANAGGGGAGGAGGGFNLGSLTSWFTDFGGNISDTLVNIAGTLSNNGMGNAGAWLANNSMDIGNVAGMAGDALGYLSAFSDLTKGNYGAAAGSAIGTFFGGPLGGMVGNVLGGLVDNLFGGGHAPHYGGYAQANADGSITDITTLQGGNQDAGMQGVVGSLAAITAGLLNTFSTNFGGAGGFGVKAGAEFNGEDAGWGFFKVLQNGFETLGFDAAGTLAAKGEEGFAQFTAQAALTVRDALQSMDIPTWAADTLSALGDSPAIEDLVNAVQQINATKVALTGMADAVAPLGGTFAQIAGLSSDAQFQLAQFAGGIDQFLQKTANYVSQYFSEEEQLALKAQSILEGAAAVGIDATSASAKNDLRVVMEHLDLSTEQGRQQMAFLLNIASDFATVGTYLQENALTLGELANASPTVAALDTLADPTQMTAEATQLTADNTAETSENTKNAADSLETVAANTTDQVNVLSAGMTQMVELLTQILDRLTAIESVDKLSDARGA